MLRPGGRLSRRRPERGRRLWSPAASARGLAVTVTRGARRGSWPRPDAPIRHWQMPPPATHPMRAFGEPDADGFFQVRSRRLGRSRTPPRSPRSPCQIPPKLEGCCFRCLATDHIKARCTFLEKCYNCWTEGHRAAVCPFQPRVRTIGAKRGRSPPRQVDGRRVLRHGGHSRCASADTVSARSASMGRSTPRPRVCAPSTPLPPPPPLPSLPPHAMVVDESVLDLPIEPGRRNEADPVPPGVSAVAPPRHPRATLVVVPRSAQIQPAEDGLGHALVAVVGGTRP